MIKVGQERKHLQAKCRATLSASPERIVIVGGGAAGFAAAEMLRRVGYQRSLVMLSSDAALPYDRPNLSKDYLAGTIPFDYVPLRDESFYEENGIEIQPGKNVAKVDVATSRGSACRPERESPMTGCCSQPGLSPFGLQFPALSSRTFIPCVLLPTAMRSLKPPRHQIGRSLSVRASLDSRSLHRFGHASSKSMSLHPTSAQWNEYSARRWASSFAPCIEEHGVIFHLETKPKAIDGAVHLENGETIKADLVVVGIGVRPRLGLAENAGLKLDRGVAVDPIS